MTSGAAQHLPPRVPTCNSAAPGAESSVLSPHAVTADRHTAGWRLIAECMLTGSVLQKLSQGT